MLKVEYVRTLPDTPDITCAQCEKVLAKYDAETDNHLPACEEIFANGAVPVPNFGWFCSQECAAKWEDERGREFFQRDEKGNVRYY